jgi:hypothetical protein
MVSSFLEFSATTAEILARHAVAADKAVLRRWHRAQRRDYVYEAASILVESRAIVLGCALTKR